MKKIISLLFVALCLSGTTPAFAQIGFGVKGGLNLAASPSMDVSKDAVKTDNYTGFFIGPMAEVAIPIVGLGADAAIMYSQKGNKFNGQTMKQQGIEIPVNLKYSIGMSSLVAVYVAAGPSFFVNLKSANEFVDALEGFPDVNEIKDKIDYETAEIAFNVGAGVKFLGSFQAGINYNIPVTDSGIIMSTLSDIIPKSSIKTRVWQVSVAYMF